MGINCEYVSEFVKDKVYENNERVFNVQEYIFGQQSYRMACVQSKVDVIITDSPLIISAVYNCSDVLGYNFDMTVLSVYNKYDNLNYLLKREHPYEQSGRVHNETAAKEIRGVLIKKLSDFNIDYKLIESRQTEYDNIINEVVIKLKKKEW